ncbi:hypothetical protein C8J56DRAFT_970041 [Mycena floridula]|nr:hypothetical protein C8J56DRAFT_970041 [Mycena floridula]
MSDQNDLEKAPNNMNSEPAEMATFDSAERELWSMYTTAASQYDKSLAKNWKGDMDAILIFAGLFTASLTALIIESYKGLSPDPAIQTVELLTRISLQLSAIHGGQEVPPLQVVEPFQPSTLIVVCNSLWFLSLGFSLACALTATLVEQWVRHYLEETQKASPRTRARIRAYLYQGMEQFGMNRVVEAVPLLLHLALMLFFLGLVIFLFPVNRIIGLLCACILALSLALYMLPTLLPTIANHSPYRTPLTSLFWFMRYQKVNLDTARISKATDISAQRSERDAEAILWLVESFTEEKEVNDFIRLVPPLTDRSGIYSHALPCLLKPGRISLGRRVVALIQETHRKTDIYNNENVATLESHYSFLRTVLHTFLLSDSPCFLDSGGGAWFHVADTLHVVSEFRYIITTPRIIQRDVITLIFAKLLLELESLSADAIAADSSNDSVGFDKCVNTMRKAVYIFRNPAPLTQVSRCWNGPYPSTLQRFTDLAQLCTKLVEIRFQPVDTAPQNLVITILKRFQHLVHETLFIVLVEYIASAVSKKKPYRSLVDSEASWFASIADTLWRKTKDVHLELHERASLVEDALTPEYISQELLHDLKTRGTATVRLWDLSKAARSVTESVQYLLEQDANNEPSHLPIYVLGVGPDPSSSVEES